MDSSDRSPVLSAVPLERIEADTGQPREDFPRPELEALADSVEALGLVHPLVVERLGADRYRLIAGERRLRALRIGRETQRRHPHFATPPVLVFSVPLPEPTRRLFQLAENLARRDLRPGELARGLQAARLALELERMTEAARPLELAVQALEPERLREQLAQALERAGIALPRVTWAEVLRRVGMRMDPAQRKSYLRLLRLPDDVLDAIDEAGLSAHAAGAVARLAGPETQRQLLAEAAARGARRAVARAAAVVENDPDLPPAEAVDRALHAHREADAARARSMRREDSELASELIENFARAAKALVRELDQATPTTFQAGTIRLLCSEVIGALAQV